MTWEEAMSYAASVIDRECAEQGIPVEITDPGLLAFTLRLIRASKERWGDGE